MSIHNYLEKQRARPEHERKRLAVVWTAIGFFIILVIWVFSFREMSKSMDGGEDPESASLDDLRNDFQNDLNIGKDSIQDMMQQPPASPAGNGAPTELLAPSADSIQNMDGGNGVNNPVENYDQNENSVPQLP